MGTMRPVMTNFASGELSPRLNGRIDLGIYGSSAQEITNFRVESMGGIKRRGGSKVIVPAKSQTGKTRLIAWNISDTIDYIIVLSDKKIHILNVSAGATPAYIQAASVDVEITSLSTNSQIDTYSEADLMDVKYAQSIKEIILVHPGYRPFFVKYLGTDATTGMVSLEYGLFTFTGNIAFSRESTVASVATTPISYSMFLSVMNNLPPNVTVAATGTLNSKTVVSIKKVITSRSRSVQATWQEYDVYTKQGILISTTITDATTRQQIIDAFPRNYGLPGSNNFEIGLDVRYPQVTVVPSLTVGDTGATFLNKIESKFGKAENVYIAFRTQILGSTDTGTVKYIPGTSTLSFLVTFDDASTLSIPAQGYTGLLQGTISVTGYGTINKEELPANDMLDNTTPWMTPNVPYRCIDSTIDGQEVLFAMKTVKSIKSRLTDNYIEMPVLSLTITDQLEPREITRDDTTVSGKLGVIVTPFYEPDDNPSVICFHQGRLCLGGSYKEPNILYLSKTNDYNNFSFFDEVEYTKTELLPSSDWTDPDVPETTTSTDIVQQIGAANGIKMQLATEESEAIRSVSSISDLVINTATSEWVFPAGLDATNARVVMTTRNGCAPIQARFVGSSLVFISSSRKGIRAYVPGPGLQSPDISQHDDYAFKAKVKAIDFRQDPRTELMAVLDDGDMMVGLMESQLPAWYRYSLGGETATIDGLSIVASGDEDAVYIATTRIINGATSRWIERIVTPDDDAFATRWYLDFSEYGTAVANKITGLTKYWVTGAMAAGLKIAVLRGTTEYYGTPAVDLNGECASITLADLSTVALVTGDKYIIGFPFESRMKTFRIDSMPTEGLEKQCGSVHLRLHDTGNFSLIRDADTTYNEVVETPTDSLGNRIYPYTGVKRVEYERPSNTDQDVTIVSSGYEPCGIQVIAPMLSISEAQ